MPNSLPQLTPEQRFAASQKAIEVRKARTRLKAEMKDGKLSIADNRRVGGLSEHRRAQVIALGGER